MHPLSTVTQGTRDEHEKHCGVDIQIAQRAKKVADSGFVGGASAGSSGSEHPDYDVRNPE